MGGAAAFWILSQRSCRAAEAEYKPAQIRLDLAPDQSKYNPTDEDLRDAAGKLQLALNADNVQVLSPFLLPADEQMHMHCVLLPCLETGADTEAQPSVMLGAMGL